MWLSKRDEGGIIRLMHYNSVQIYKVVKEVNPKSNARLVHCSEHQPPKTSCSYTKPLLRTVISTPHHPFLPLSPKLKYPSTTRCKLALPLYDVISNQALRVILNASQRSPESILANASVHTDT